MLRRVVIASVLGNAFEWYDFSIYGMFAGLIAKLYFPSGEPLTSLMLALMSFGVGFAVRPIGGLFLGMYGDRVGRKRALSLTILMMAGGTALIGIIPTYETLGIMAPVLIIFARMIQGASAGGEFSGATTMLIEFAPANRRGLLGSFQMCAQALSFACGAATVWLLQATLAPTELETWGWRLPFLFGILIGPLGWLIRSRVDESPEFVALEAGREHADRRPARKRIRQLLSMYPREILVSTGIAVIGTVSAYVLIVFLPLYAHQFGVEVADTSRGTLFAMAIIFVLSPVAGYLSDVVGRKRILAVSAVLYGVVVWVFLRNFVAFPTVSALMSLQVAAAVCMAFFWGIAPAILAEAFPVEVRSTGVSLTYNFAVLVFGGFAPSINIWLIKMTGSKLAPLYYIELSVVIGLISAFFMNDPHDHRIDVPATTENI